MNLYQVIYVSTAMKLFTEYELTEILIVSRELNHNNNITGMLLYAEGTFLQVLEGERDMIGQTYRRILLDTRHKNIIELVASPITERTFGDWAMGFASVNNEILEMFAGYSDPAKPGFLDKEKRNATIQMLKGFVADNRMN